jgi:hypothetical protein
MINWPEFVLPIVGVVDHCKLVVGSWVVMPSCGWFYAPRNGNDPYTNIF